MHEACQLSTLLERNHNSCPYPSKFASMTYRGDGQGWLAEAAGGGSKDTMLILPVPQPGPFFSLTNHGQALHGLVQAVSC